jgi:methionyl-tRNA formyltransferase
MRTLFIGGTKRGYLTLKGLLDFGAEIVGVISLEQDAHEVERYEDAIRRLAQSHRTPVIETKWMKEQDYGKVVAETFRPDIVIAVGARIIFPPAIYQLPQKGCVAVHDSLLPEYRGFAPLNWAIINGEDHTGVTLFYLNELMDGGDIIGQRRIPIGPDETAPEVYKRVCEETVSLVLEFYPLIEAGTAPRVKQNYQEGSFTCSRTPLDGWIDWGQPTRAIHNKIRALTHPYPGAFTVYKSKRLWILRAKPLNPEPQYVGRIPGRVVAVSLADGYVDVLTGDGALRLFEVQHEGESRAPAASVIKSVKATLGLQVADLLKYLERYEARVGERS